jgi:2-methylisocitrate lyase-like PEP mutase family enzyme
MGAACVMIEDQVSPKRCGHTQGKAVVDREEARQRIRAAAEAARQSGVLLLARTDARAVLGFEEALARCRMFADEGADIVFLEAPESEEEMVRACRAVDRPMMANVINGGKSPVVPPERMRQIGFRLAVYPMVPFAAALHAMQAAVGALRAGDADKTPPEMSFDDIKRIVGFPEYYALETRFAAKP